MKISLTLQWKPVAVMISWHKNARKSGSPQSAQLSLGFTHNLPATILWLKTKLTSCRYLGRAECVTSQIRTLMMETELVSVFEPADVAAVSPRQLYWISYCTTVVVGLVERFYRVSNKKEVIEMPFYKWIWLRSSESHTAEQRAQLNHSLLQQSMWDK